MADSCVEFGASILRILWQNRLMARSGISTFGIIFPFVPMLLTHGSLIFIGVLRIHNVLYFSLLGNSSIFS